MVRKLAVLCFSGMLMLFVLAACSSAEGNNEVTADGVPADLTIGGSTVGGFWYTLGAAMGDKMKDVFPGSSVTITEGGSISNLQGLGDGVYPIAFSSGPMITQAMEGLAPFEGKIDNVSTVATLYPTVFHIVVRGDSDIHTLEDLKGKRVSPGVKGYGGELAFMDVLESVDMNYDDLGGIEYIGSADAADLLRDSHIDAIATINAAPNSTFQELDTTVGIRILSLDTETVEALTKVNEGYIPHTIEAGTYSNIKEDINTFAPYSVLLVNDDLMDEEAVYKLTKMMFEEEEHWKKLSTVLDHFNSEYSLKNNVGDIHPGAERYYKEIGAME